MDAGKLIPTSFDTNYHQGIVIPTSTKTNDSCRRTVQVKHILGNEEKEEEQPREYDKANHLRAARCMNSLGKMRKHPTVACIHHTTR